MDLFYKLIPYDVTDNEKAFPEFTKRIHGVSVTLDSATNRDGRIDAVVKVNKIHTGQITMVKEPRSPTGWAINSAGRMDFEQGKTVWYTYIGPFIAVSNQLLAKWGRGC
uniref:Carboxypeptidase regulatory-like domain-containing protein n=1 Tax=Caenorhabditis tropicalis TaxID=1561998 RepID=A0A1I7V3R4_9PELO